MEKARNKDKRKRIAEILRAFLLERADNDYTKWHTMDYWENLIRLSIAFEINKNEKE